MFVACAVQCDRRLSTNGTGHLAFERSAEPTRCAHARQQVRWPAASHPNDDKSLPPKRHSQASVESPVARMQHVVQIVEPPQTVHMPARLFARFSYHAMAARPAGITAGWVSFPQPQQPNARGSEATSQDLVEVVVSFFPTALN